MKIGVSGHRHRDGANWNWVRAQIEGVVASLHDADGLTSLAPGADQIFAEVVLNHGRTLTAVLPTCCGRIELEDDDKREFDRLLLYAAEVVKVQAETRDEAFLEAGKRVADLADRMVFVWDGRPSRGLGGTADIVAYAAAQRKYGVILDPVGCTARSLISLW